MQKVHLLCLAEIDLYVEHLCRHLPEAGVDGIISQPFPIGEAIDPISLKRGVQQRWENVLRESLKRGVEEDSEESDWEVVWGFFDGGRIVGHLDLKGTSFQALKHRARLGMGIENAYRGRGIGTALMEKAMAWAHSNENLSWIDLDVFAHNKVAMKLYTNFGFTLVGKTIDRIRVSGQSIDDCHFVCDLNALRKSG